MHGTAQPSAGSGQTYDIRSNFYLPPPSLQGCLTSIFRLEIDVAAGGLLHDQLQPEWGSIRFFSGASPSARIEDSKLEGARFAASGPTSRPTRFTIGSTRMWGIGFLPLGWARLVDTNASSLANKIFDGATHKVFSRFDGLSLALCNDVSTEAQQLDAIVEALEQAARTHRDEDKVARVHQALYADDASTVASLAEGAQLSVRSLERVCARHFGFAPKTLLQRQRFMRSLTDFMLARGSKWSEVLDQHYHDQAQFSREFKIFMGVTPRDYADQPHPFLDSFIEARARSLGSPALTLDRPA